MTDINQMEQRALALLNEVRAEYPLVSSEVASNLALCRAIEQHEAYRQEVSDAIQTCMLGPVAEERLSPFIISKPDPLVEVLQEISGEGGYDNFDHYAYRLRSALEARGLEVRKIGEKAGE